jgi:uncharacterized membrane protein
MIIGIVRKIIIFFMIIAILLRDEEMFGKLIVLSITVYILYQMFRAR